MGLKTYRAKRNFRKTPEPSGARKSRPSPAEPRFVIQKHDASHLHYDFRLEMGGTLKSWAVPKGLPLQHGERRLAVQVEDHPLDYADFEGIIGPGNYGAGTVMVWDRGTYEVAGEDPLRALEAGKLHFTLRGKKLKGEWALVRMKPRENETKPQWLIFKSGDDARPLSARAEDQSVLTGRSLKQIAEARDAEWESNRPAAKTRRTPISTPAPSHATPKPCLPSETRGLPKARPAFVPPMMCQLVTDLPKGPDWLYEIKFDGVRALAIKERGKVRLISRNEKDLTAKYAEVSQAVEQFACRDAVFDGEVVALDEKGRSSFQLLQAINLPGRQKSPIAYYLFDVLNLEGRDLKNLPLVRRKQMLESLITDPTGTIRNSPGIEADSQRVMREMQSRGLEGLVAKRRDSHYQPGRRGPAWVKFKWTLEQEFVIGGYTEPRGSRSNFGAIIVGYFEKRKLMFASKVGTGFDQDLLRSLFERFQKLRQKDCPFVNLPTPRTQERAMGISASDMRRCTWLKPQLVCEIKFAEWTEGGHLRQPVFLGLREDKDPQEVVRERPR